ncbi:MAG: MBL fold metallo-hydrolase [Acidimicrobiia bacterium]
MTLESPGQEPVILDLGTGLRFYGEVLAARGEAFRGSALVTHLHWDHVQGLPFFVPVLQPGSRLDVYGPPTERGSLAESFDVFLRPPYFPVSVDELPGEIRFHDVLDDDFALEGAKVRARSVPHVGPTCGFRVEMGGRAVAYISDHQMPVDGSHAVVDEVLELCDGVDLLIHDAQYTPEEFAAKAHWGHSTIDFAVFVAAQAGVRRLVPFHHDPGHDDDAMDRLLDGARALPGASTIDEVLAAHEGLHISFDG